MATPIYNFPVPSLADPPNGPADLLNLALAIEDEILRIDNIFAGSTWTQLPNGVGNFNHFTNYRKRSGLVTIAVHEERTVNNLGATSFTIGTLPTGHRPSIDLHGVVMNQHTNTAYLLEILQDGAVRLINAAANVGQRFRGLINFPV